MNDLEKLLALIRSQEFGDALRFLQSVTITGNMGKVWKTDAQKVELFIRDSFAYALGEGAKALDAIKLGDAVGAEHIIAGLAPFVGDLELVLKAYGKRADTLRGFQFPKDLWSGKYKDPFKPERALAEAFRAKWL